MKDKTYRVFRHKQTEMIIIVHKDSYTCKEMMSSPEWEEAMDFDWNV